MDYPTVDITDEMIEAAEQYESQVLSHFTDDNNYTGLSSKRRFFYGHLGELIFKDWLDFHEISYQADFRSDGHADNGDFFLDWFDASRKVIDVKTATQPYYNRLMIPHRQYVKYANKYDFYVGVRLNMDRGQAEITGYHTPDGFEVRESGFDEQHAPTVHMPISELLSPYRLLDYCVRC